MLHLYMFSVGCALDPHNEINVSYYCNRQKQDHKILYLLSRQYCPYN